MTKRIRRAGLLAALALVPAALSESGFLSIFLSSGRHNTSCEGAMSMKSAAVWVAALLVASSIRFIVHLPLGDHDGGV